MIPLPSPSALEDPAKSLAADQSAAPMPDPIPLPKTVKELQAALTEARAQVAAQAATIESLSVANAAYEVKLEAFTAVKDDADEFEKLVVAKIALGLTRVQSEAVVRRQRHFDKSDIGRIQRARFEARQTGR
jgi:hypothetical protein